MEFSVFQVEIPSNYGHRPNLKWNRFKYLHLGPTKLSVPKLPLLPNPYFLAEIGNWNNASAEISFRQQSLPSLKSDRHPVPKLWASVFLVPKMGQCPKSTMPRPYPDFIEEFYSCGWFNRILKIWPKFTKSISCESPLKFWAQKRECGPKKNSMGGNIFRLKFIQKNVAKHWFDTIHLFSLIVLVYIAIEVVRKIDLLR